jgi:hypothetical protein
MITTYTCGRITWLLSFDKDTFQGKVERQDVVAVYSRVFYIPDTQDVYFVNIEALPESVTEQFKKEIMSLYHY